MGTSVFPPVSAGKIEKTDIITSTQSWTAPAGVTKVNLLVVGGGGGGGYSTLSGIVCGGGGGGGLVVGDFTVSPGTSYTVTIGAGGGQSTNGGNTTFGSLATARGGGFGASGEGRGGSGGCGGGGASRFGDANYVATKRGGGGGGAGELTNTAIVSGFVAGIGYQGGHGHGPQPTTDAVLVSGGAAYLGRYGGGGGGCYQGSVNANDPTQNLPYGGGYPMSGGMGGYSNNQTGAVFSGGNGVANSGGGGGGGGMTAYGYPGPGNGGSGVCIIKYWA